MSRHTPEEPTRIYSDRPYLVYANLGEKGDRVAIKQFASRKEAEEWIVLISAERPDCYDVIHQSEFEIL